LIFIIIIYNPELTPKPHEIYAYIDIFYVLNLLGGIL
jgi:hypothetical protein